jgi:hypothetical protein
MYVQQNSMKNLLACASAVLVCVTANAQLPADFPTVTVTTNFAAGVGDGYIFQAINLPAPGVGYYAMILGNDGNPIWYTALTNACWDFKVLPNGYLHYAQQIRALSYTGGGDVIHQILDGNYYLAESIKGGNGYAAEAHDFKLLPNGNVLLIGYYLSRVDMSQIVTNGNPAALVSGAVLQELDAQRNVVWQWRSWDHYPFTSQWVNSTAAVISEFHINCVFLDNDANLVISTPNWVKKINRQTGDIMWHLGGTENQFTFVGVSPQQGIDDFNCHDINRLPNGDVLLYNNSQFGQPGSTSSVHEYSLDETNLIATHVWTYTPAPAVSGPFQGSAQRLTNGNTFIGWGGLPGVTKVACTEVAGTNVVFQMKFDNTNVVSYRSFRFPYPTYSQGQVVQLKELASGNSYAFAGIGVSIDVQSGGGGYNQLTATREPYAPVYPLFQGIAPLVLPTRVSLSESALGSISGSVDFDAQSFHFDNPTNLTVYYRQTTGQGLFLAQPTSYNPVTHALSATVSLTSEGSDFGEFIFGYPDLADVPFAPLLNEVQTYPGVPVSDVIAPRMATAGATYSVNEQLPILLSWSPKGFARSYQFQIATNQDFSTTLVSVAYQNDAFFVWTDAAPNTVYFYRAMTVNDGGSSDWSVGSFQTVAPFISLAVPNAGVAFQRGAKYFIRWNGNISENVSIELYKGGVLAKTLATNAPSTGAYQWQVGFDIVPGADYTIKISSTTEPGLFAQSAPSFSIIDPPGLIAGSATRLADGRVQFGITVPGATQVSVLRSTDLQFWQFLQTLPLNSGSALFTDNTATNLPASFYRLRVP